MTTAAPPPSRLRRLLDGGGVIALAIVVMNVTTYAFQMVAARLMGPNQYGALASLLALLLVVGVLQLGLQATAARRIAASPEDVGRVEHGMLRIAYVSSLVLCAVLLVLSPAIERLLRLDSIYPALLLAVGAIPLTIMGAQAGILQGERRWRPLAAVYLAAGVPRLAIGTVALLIRPTEGSAMAAVTLSWFVPVVIGWFTLRQGNRAEAPVSLRPMIVEIWHGSFALLAFFALSNVDIVIARNVLSDRDSGLYAAGLILTKAVLFLPQFVTVVAFPAMSTAGERRRALLRSLGVVGVLGAISVAGAVVLSGLAMIFIGGAQYSDVEDELWLFALLGTMLAALQLLVYAVLARQSRRSAFLVWAAVVVVVVVGLQVASLTALVTLVCSVDAVLLAVLLAVSLWRMKGDLALADQ
ncbi:polysaccharide biosynthesis protein [Nocardioides sp. CER19]|uniref:lipopolysaccharide biosynthesis protein n=1 Tax=Nocardioides sp. CER19 TaxID=3038538 RepID=UPI00244B8658|nr:polysaccharide biosynthesis protein [Nocardioides sp. CER19]MDH2416641.1 polysaccharide biosynthesis protein [Nocardioides sp. CER19]